MQLAARAKMTNIDAQVVIEFAFKATKTDKIPCLLQER